MTNNKQYNKLFNIQVEWQFQVFKYKLYSKNLLYLKPWPKIAHLPNFDNFRVDFFRIVLTCHFTPQLGNWIERLLSCHTLPSLYNWDKINKLCLLCLLDVKTPIATFRSAILSLTKLSSPLFLKLVILSKFRIKCCQRGF